MIFILGLLLRVTVTFFAVIAISIAPSSGKDLRYLYVDELLSNRTFVQPSKVLRAKDGDNVLILDGGTHRVLLLSRRGDILRTFGQIGHGRGELFHPGDIVLGKDGSVYVEDTGNHRIVVFSENGEFIAEIPNTGRSYGLAVNSAGHILLGQPQRGSLVTVYDSQGQVIRSFGRLRRISELYNTNNLSLDKKYRLEANRVSIALDQRDNVYLAFLVAPVLQKYDTSGNLILEKQLEGRHISEMKKIFWQQEPGKSLLSTTLDGKPVDMITRGLAVDPRTQFPIIHLGNSRLYIANRDGEKQEVLYPTSKTGKTVGQLLRISVDDHGVAYFVSVFTRKLFAGSIPIPGEE